MLTYWCTWLMSCVPLPCCDNTLLPPAAALHASSQLAGTLEDQTQYSKQRTLRCSSGTAATMRLTSKIKFKRAEL